MTIGVQHRIETLADRSEAEATPPPTAGEVSNLVPLPELLGEIANTGPASKTVERGYGRMLANLGSELSILQSVPLEDIARANSSLVAEAIARLRAGRVIRDAGYDGEYGVISLFQDDELRRRTAGGLLFETPLGQQKNNKRPKSEASATLPSRHTEVQGREAAEPRSIPSSCDGRVQHPPQDDAAKDVLAALDDDQRAAASVVDGPLLIIAGPGSGKTRTLMHRIVHIVAERGVAAEHCLAITFTRRAAAEMKERLHASLGDRASPIPVHTFHSLGLSMLREHANAAGLKRGFRIASEVERVSALAAALDVPQPRAQSLLRAISKAERMAALPTGEVAHASAAYRNILAANNWIDFDELVGRAVSLLADHPDIATLYRERFHFISVDEFQDVDQAQYRLLTLLAPPPTGNLCIIGDPHQAIYGFRGADSSCFDRFRSDYPNTATVALKRNYRSSGTIVAAASQIIAAQPDEPIAEMVRDMYERITIHAAPTERAEAEFVVATIERAIGGASFFSIDSGRANGEGAALSFADFAVLYRTEGQSTALIEAFARSGIPFRKHSHTPLAEEPAVKAILGALEIDAAPSLDLAQRLTDAAARDGSDNEEAAAINLALQRLLLLAERQGGDPQRFRDAIALATDADFWDPRADGVALLTLHAAKGLEFGFVFIVGLEDGILPLHWGDADHGGAEALAEERRLFYVGMTRAKDRLFLSRALKRLWRGRIRAQAASPFLADIESELTRQQQATLRRKRDDRQLKLL